VANPPQPDLIPGFFERAHPSQHLFCIRDYIFPPSAASRVWTAIQRTADPDHHGRLAPGLTLTGEPK
jgi:hypothetical protein